MEQTFIKEIIALISNSNITEFILEQNNTKLICRKATVEVEGTLVKNETNIITDEVKAETMTLNSPIVGSFYAKASPNAAKFVEVGDEVQVGDKIAIIEAMKVMNEIKSTHKGRIIRSCITDGDMVQVGQPLFEIEVIE